MREIPLQDSIKFNLMPSEEYQNNWVFINNDGIHLSVALSAIDLMPFKELWDQVKNDNTVIKEGKWI